MKIMSETKVYPTSVYAEMTPNPATIRFVADRSVVAEGLSLEFMNKAEARGNSNLADDLFNFPFVDTIFIQNNFVAVTKNESISWDFVTMQLREFIRDFLLKNEFAGTQAPKAQVERKEEKKKAIQSVGPSEYDATIESILEEFVKPAVAKDGGAIDFVSFNDGVVTVELRGACSGCPSSTVTLKNGIETLLKQKIDVVKEVVAVEL